MNILYCSTVCSEKKLKRISEKIKYPLTSVTVQKFHRLIIKGLVMNDADVDAVSTPIASSRFWNSEKKDKEDGIRYHYLSTIEIPILRHICIILGVVFQSLKWNFSKKGERVVICDVLNISICMGALFSKLLGRKVIGIVTDMPGLVIGTSSKSIVRRIITNINLFVLNQFDAYIFLTEAMNEIINKHQRPYIIMEGLVDKDMDAARLETSNGIRDIIYAGGIFERYGVKMLIDAFRELKSPDISLSIFGNGDMKEDMKKYEEQDKRFHYLGVVPNDEVIKAELKATLLVNPRPTKEEFTKYSFPSKNMEYMVSGTPVLTMALPGMPKEYYNNLFVCYDETVDGLANKLQEILDLPEEELKAVGQRGKDFVLKHKNNKIQSLRIINLIQEIIH